MDFVRGLFSKKEPPTREEELNNKEFSKFRSTVPCQKATVGITNAKTWRFYDHGDLSKAPIVCLPPAGGSADVFFKLFNQLPDKGIRLIAVQNPGVKDHDEWIESFSQFLNHLKLKRVHLLGVGVGGFLSLLFIRVHPQRILSTILINSYSSNLAIVEPTVKYEFAPAFVLKKILQLNLQDTGAASSLASVVFFKQHMDDLQQAELYSSIVLERAEAFIDKRKIDTKTTTIIESDDFSSLPASVRQSLPQTFPTARIVTLKRGGDFPFISESEEIALHITVHMRRLDPSLLPAEVLKQIPSYKQSTEKVGSAPVKGDEQTPEEPTGGSSSSNAVVEVVEETEEVEEEVEEGDGGGAEVQQRSDKEEGNKGLF